MRIKLTFLVIAALLAGCSDNSNQSDQITSAQAKAIWSAIESVSRGTTEDTVVSEIQARDVQNTMGDMHDGGVDVGRDGGVDQRDGGVRERDAGLRRRDGGDHGNDGGPNCLGMADAGPSGWTFCGGLNAFAFSGQVDNPAGGHAAVVGNGGSNQGGYGVSMTITFVDWLIDGQPLNGDVTLTLSITALNPLALTLTATGSPTLTLNTAIGPLPVPAPVDVTVTAAGSTWTVCGTVAGISVDSDPTACAGR